MSSLLYRINSVLSRMVAGVPMGTHRGLLHLLGRRLSGRLLPNRGAVIPGLADLGLTAEAVRRCGAARAYGKWQASQWLGAWEQLLREEGCFQAHPDGGYRPGACDLLGFFRPRLQACPTKPSSSAAGKALPALCGGIAARVGWRAASRRALPPGAQRGDRSPLANPPAPARLLQKVQAKLADDEAIVCDRGVLLRQIQAADIPRYVLRGPIHFTARRAALPA
jgi:hypothetical protein